MCFSATASFGAATVLSVAGAVAIGLGKTKAQRLFGAIPLIFSIQQFTEGMLWLSMKNPHLAIYHSLFTILFLVFALLLWPVYVPFTVWLLEKDRKRKKILGTLLCAGGAVTLSLIYVLLSYPVRVIGDRHHIHFSFDIPAMAKNIKWVVSLGYFTATITAPFIAGYKRMKWLGIAFLVTFVFTVIFYSGFLVSVWCYFAALVSVVIIWIIRGFQKQFPESVL